jgi:hypothetical protein
MADTKKGAFGALRYYFVRQSSGIFPQASTKSFNLSISD